MEQIFAARPTVWIACSLSPSLAEQGQQFGSLQKIIFAEQTLAYPTSLGQESEKGEPRFLAGSKGGLTDRC